MLAKKNFHRNCLLLQYILCSTHKIINLTKCKNFKKIKQLLVWLMKLIFANVGLCTPVQKQWCSIINSVDVIY